MRVTPERRSAEAQREATGEAQRVIAAVQNGERSVFDSVVRAHAAPLIRFVFGYVHDRAAAEDVVQDVFFHLWQDRESIVVHTTLVAYLYAAARSRALNVLRRSRLAEGLETRWSGDGDPEEGPDGFMGQRARPLDEALETEDRHRLVQRAIAALPPVYQRTLALRFTQGLSHHEITAVLGISPKTVETRITRGLRMLRERLGASLDSWR